MLTPKAHHVPHIKPPAPPPLALGYVYYVNLRGGGVSQKAVREKRVVQDRALEFLHVPSVKCQSTAGREREVRLVDGILKYVFQHISFPFQWQKSFNNLFGAHFHYRKYPYIGLHFQFILPWLRQISLHKIVKFKWQREHVN